MAHLLTTAEAAARLNTTPNALRSRYARGGIPSGIVVKIGKMVRYDEARLLAWLEECRRRSRCIAPSPSTHSWRSKVSP